MNQDQALQLAAKLSERSHVYLSEAHAEAAQFVHDILNDVFADEATCILCGHGERIEKHHVAGRRHGDLLVPVCQPCHQHLTECQDLWDARWQHKMRSPQLDQALLLRGLYDLLKRKAHHVPESQSGAFHAVASSIREQYATAGRRTL